MGDSVRPRKCILHLRLTNRVVSSVKEVTKATVVVYRPIARPTAEPKIARKWCRKAVLAADDVKSRTRKICAKVSYIMIPMMRALPLTMPSLALSLQNFCVNIDGSRKLKAPE